MHKFNPIRISYLRRKIIKNFLLEEKSLRPFSNIEILDIGCGGGLIAEPFSRMGAEVTAIDASEKNIAIAKIHAQKSDLKINYQVKTAEELAQENKKFDVVFALEIIEHVADVENFIKSCSQLVKPNGLLFIATMNRTLKSLALAKIAAEYVLRWLPVGTHDWRRFLKPSEINAYASGQGLELEELRGFSYNILCDEWREGEDIGVNYIMSFNKSPVIA